MNSIHYTGLDIHKKEVAICQKTQGGKMVSQLVVPATRKALGEWAASLKHPWIGAMEATLFTGWIFDFLKPYAVELKVAHPAMLKAIAASKKKNDRVDAEKIADLLRCDLLPECYMAPAELRELRRVLRYRNLIVQESVRMQNKAHGLLMEVGAEYNKQKLRGKKYFAQLLDNIKDVPKSVVDMLKLTRSNMDLFQSLQKTLKDSLAKHPLLAARVARLTTVKGVGEVTALTWALEIGEPERFGAIAKAVSYCGLCSAQNSSAGKEKRGPISKQRNKHLQTVLIEAAKLAPRWNADLAVVHARELARGGRNRATLAVARRLVAYLAVDKSGKEFVSRIEDDINQNGKDIEPQGNEPDAAA